MKFFISYIKEYPIRLLHGSVKNNNADVPIYVTSSPNHEWGISSITDANNMEAMPKELQIELVWMSIVDYSFFCCITKIDIGQSSASNSNISVAAGLSPNGEVVIWVQNIMESHILGVLNGVDITSSIDDKIVHALNIYNDEDERISSLIQLNTHNEKLFAYALNGKVNLSVPDHLLQQRMRQFYSRYVFEGDFLSSDEHVLDKVSRFLSDGTFSKKCDYNQTQYHLLGKPYRLAVKWHVGVTEFSMYIWFYEDEVDKIFSSFCNVDNEEKFDIVFRLSLEKQNLEISLLNLMSRKSMYFQEEAYQLIVFRDGFEYFRSENYNQERGAWNW